MSTALRPALPLGIAAPLAAGWVGAGALAAQALTPGRPAAVGVLWSTGLVAIAAGLVPRVRPRWARLSLVALALAALPLLLLDLLAWQTARQGLATLVEVTAGEGWRGLAEVLNASGVGVGTVTAVLLAPALIAGLGTRSWAKRERTGRRLRWRPWAAVALTALTVACVVDQGARWPLDALRALVGDRHVLSRQDVEPPRVDLPGPPLAPIVRAAGALPARRPASAAARTLVVVVVESLRYDAVEPAAMPALSAYAARAARFPQARAAANATHPAWYALLFARRGLWWHTLRTRAAPGGAPPLQALRRAGYKIAFFAGAGLNYYGVADRGVDPVAHVRIDARDCFKLGHVTRPALDGCATRAALAELRAAADDDRRRAVFVFVDGTHFPYAWPAGERPRFTPVASAEALRLGQVRDRGALRNRYRSALAAVDKLLAPLLAALVPLRARGGVAVVVTGDHGEELLEHGRLSHDSELCDLQTRVPMLVEAQGLAPGEHPGLAAHIDVLPTLLHAAQVRSPPVDGAPLQLGARSWASVVHTAAHSPSLLALQTATSTLEVAVDRRDNPQAIRRLYLLRLTTPAGEVVRGDLNPPAARARVWRLHGDALQAVFGATQRAVLGSQPAPAPAPRYWATWEVVQRATAEAPLVVRVHNRGHTTWLHDVALSLHWRRAGPGEAGVHDPEGPRVVLPRALAPGESCDVQLPRLQPPAGPWRAVELDLVREGVTWFAQRGSPTLRLPSAALIGPSPPP